MVQKLNFHMVLQCELVGVHSTDIIVVTFLDQVKGCFNCILSVEMALQDTPPLSSHHSIMLHTMFTFYINPSHHIKHQSKSNHGPNSKSLPTPL